MRFTSFYFQLMVENYVSNYVFFLQLVQATMVSLNTESLFWSAS
jgi:hypothetical protein